MGFRGEVKGLGGERATEQEPAKSVAFFSKL